MSGSLADRLADTAFRLAAGLDCDDAPRPAKRVRVTAAIDGAERIAGETMRVECGPEPSREDGMHGRQDTAGAEEMTGVTTRRSLHERERQPLPAASSSFDDWITMVIKVPTAIAPGAVCKIFSPDGRAHFVTVPTSLPPGGSFIKALPKAYTEDVLKTLDRSEMKQWLRHRLELAGRADQQKYNALNPSRPELLRTCVQWLRDAKAKVLQEAAQYDDKVGHEDASEVSWRPAWSGTYERPYWWHPVTRDTVWERPDADAAAVSKDARTGDARTEEPDLCTPSGSCAPDAQTHPYSAQRESSAGGGSGNSAQQPVPGPPEPLPPEQ